MCRWFNLTGISISGMVVSSIVSSHNGLSTIPMKKDHSRLNSEENMRSEDMRLVSKGALRVNYVLLLAQQEL